ncbi:uncharacterized protein VICG_00280 [Vittaforma corneae ATCC 50505]|uniref:Uncharacterized protein n=1 Tax=Vittaforma corneae (strain ATCC 50505) TaxID=993615 RepID=L2GNR3_VITCO|nr:uncharacterized protein VICG_00280 [Vittaforma corneae ATCC 50505]ELA42528.1 hypothetical protein VICG_00280 [Vittaforma corneae ATCC 50505]
MISEESVALKYIFKSNYDERSNIVTFNGREYSYNDIFDDGDLYIYIYKCEMTKPRIIQEETREIDAEMDEIQKITEEQFLEWKKFRKYENKTQRSLTGKDIWESKKLEEPIE